MVIEQARTRAVAKPWGSMDLQPWSRDAHEGTAIGEIWFQRADANAPAPALLLKLLFTKEALSIQVRTTASPNPSAWCVARRKLGTSCRPRLTHRSQSD